MASQFVTAGLVFQLILSLALPIAGFIYLKRKYSISFRPVLIGILIFFVFANILGGTFNQFILIRNGATAAFFEQHPMMFAIYGGLSAGFFEEMGRFVAFTWLLKMYRERKDGLAYGLGHGGIEAILVGVLGAVQLIVLTGLHHSGKLQETLGALPAEAAGQITAAIEGVTFAAAFMGGLERAAAFFIQIALSLLVLYGVRTKKYWCVPAAILLHALIDFFAGFYQAGLLSLYVAEAVIYLMGAAAAVFIVKSRKMKGLEDW